MGKWEANLPAVLEPVGDICVQVTIPAHPDYVKLFVRAVRMLEVNRNYARDENLSAKIVCAQWRDRTVNPLIEALATGTGSCGVDGECLAYPPFANFISYFPQNPYTDPDLVPDGFLAPPFYVNGKDAEHTITTHEIGDVIVALGAINLEPSWNLDNTPRIELCLSGSGVAEIHFLNIVQGGVAIISLDNPVDLGDIIAGVIGDGIKSIDLNQDIVSLPPESAEEIIIEVEVPTEGDHIIYIYFLPTVNDSLIPLAFGGGIREISLCGNLRPCGMPAPEPPPPLEGVTELKPEFNFTADCGLEYRLRDQEDNVVQDWQPVPGWIENFADCVGGMNMATKDDIRDGIYEAFNRLALQVASGRYTDIVVGDDGTVTDPTEDGGGAGLPDDDPATPGYDETLAAIMGGTINICRELEKLFDKADLLYGVVNGSPVTPEADTAEILHSYFPSDEVLMQVGVGNYYVWRNTTGLINFGTNDVFQRYMFCNGYNASAFNRWIIDASGYALARQKVMIGLVEALSAEFWSQAFAKGAAVPSVDYNAASCTRARDENFTLDMSTSNAPQYTTSEIWKKGHRFLIEISGTFQDSDNPNIIGDGMYFHDTSTGIKTFSTITFNSGMNLPTQAQVPYEPSNVYAFTVDRIAGTADAVCIITKDNGVMALPNVSGTLSFKVTDLGEWAT